MSLQGLSHGSHWYSFHVFHSYICSFTENSRKRRTFCSTISQCFRSRVLFYYKQRYIFFLECSLADHHHDDHCWLWRLLSSNHLRKSHRCHSCSLGDFHRVFDGCCAHKYSQHGPELKKSLNCSQQT